MSQEVFNAIGILSPPQDQQSSNISTPMDLQYTNPNNTIVGQISGNNFNITGQPCNLCGKLLPETLNISLSKPQ